MTSMAYPTVVAFVDDLMDRSRLQGIRDIRFTRDPAACGDATVVIVDLARHADHIPEIVRVAPGARIIAFGSHVDTGALDAAARDGATLVLARSRFFADPWRAVLDALPGLPGPPGDLTA